ncbi:MAG: hypothetical protein KDD62_04850 [Bdellovibrionales bacterium]|nr:hypothetical protein [Bdellovibrionales bacterium]
MLTFSIDGAGNFDRNALQKAADTLLQSGALRLPRSPAQALDSQFHDALKALSENLISLALAQQNGTLDMRISIKKYHGGLSVELYDPENTPGIAQEAARCIDAFADHIFKVNDIPNMLLRYKSELPHTDGTRDFVLYFHYLGEDNLPSEALESIVFRLPPEKDSSSKSA